MQQSEAETPETVLKSVRLLDADQVAAWHGCNSYCHAAKLMRYGIARPPASCLQGKVVPPQAPPQCLSPVEPLPDLAQQLLIVLLLGLKSLIKQRTTQRRINLVRREAQGRVRGAEWGRGEGFKKDAE